MEKLKNFLFRKVLNHKWSKEKYRWIIVEEHMNDDIFLYETNGIFISSITDPKKNRNFYKRVRKIQ